MVNRVNEAREKATSGPAASRVRNKHFLAFVLVSVSILLAYANSLNGTWALDDVVVNKPVGMGDIRDLLGFRKVAYLTFFLNQLLAPFSPASFRLVNIMIHLVNTLLVYLLAYKTMTLKSESILPETETKGVESVVSNHSRAFFAALLSAVLFGLHPININAVAYIVQRMASLATLFVLLALILYIYAAESKRRTKTVLLYALSGACFVAGIFSKENAVMAVPLIVLYDYVFLSNFRGKEFLKRLLIIGLVGILSVGLASYFLRFHDKFVDLVGFFLNPNRPVTDKGWMAVDVYWTPLQHFLTEFRVLARYLFLIALPLPQFLVFDRWGFPISQGITQPGTTLFAIVLVLSLLIFSVWKLKRFPMLCFGILWYLIAISLESFLALGSDLYFEHRNYLPVAGLFIGISGQVAVMAGQKVRPRQVWAAGIILCSILGMLTFSRNAVWKDSLTLWGDTLKKDPENIRAVKAMGNAYLRVSDFDNAERYYEEAVRRSARGRRLHFLNDAAYDLGMVYLFKHELQNAKELIERFDYRLVSYKPRILRGFYKALSNDLDGALTDYQGIINKTEGIDKVVVLTLMGNVYREKGLWNDAIGKYDEAIALDPAFAAAHYGVGLVFMNRREITRAIDCFNKVLSLDPNHILALSDMADILTTKSRPEEALLYAQRAIAKSPPFYQPYLAMGNVLVVLGKEGEAESFYGKALEKGLPAYMVPFGKARAYYLRGDMGKVRYYISELQKYRDAPEQVRNLSKQ